MTELPILIADIGGTNARFAISDHSPTYFQYAQTLEASKFETMLDAIDSYLHSHDIQQLGGICLAVAGPIRHNKVDFPNSHWSIDAADLAQRYNTQKVLLLNDWEAIAYSLNSLIPSDLESIGGNWQAPSQSDFNQSDFNSQSDFNIGALGPGSGLGVAGLLRRSGKLIPLITEGGHAGFSPENETQVKILNYLHQKFEDRVSRERLLSGPGLVNIHEALCQIYKQDNLGLTAADIALAGVNKTNLICIATLELFFEILGQVAGDIALALGAYDGIFIGGGICQRYPEHLVNSKFRQGFENKGRHSKLMHDIPTWLIKHKNPGLIGTSVFAQSRVIVN